MYSLLTGDMSAHLHTTNKEKDCEIERLRQEQALLKEERNSILTDSQVTVQEKQAEIRKLTADLERMEVESARLHANKNQEVTAIQQEYKHKVGDHHTFRMRFSNTFIDMFSWSNQIAYATRV